MTTALVSELEKQFHSRVTDIANRKAQLKDLMWKSVYEQIRPLVESLRPLRIDRIQFDRASAYYESDVVRIVMPPYTTLHPADTGETGEDTRWYELLWWAKETPDGVRGQLCEPVHWHPHTASAVVGINALCNWLMESTEGELPEMQFDV